MVDVRFMKNKMTKLCVRAALALHRPLEFHACFLREHVHVEQRRLVLSESRIGTPVICCRESPLLHPFFTPHNPLAGATVGTDPRIQPARQTRRRYPVWCARALSRRLVPLTFWSSNVINLNLLPPKSHKIKKNLCRIVFCFSSKLSRDRIRVVTESATGLLIAH